MGPRLKSLFDELLRVIRKNLLYFLAPLLLALLFLAAMLYTMGPRVVISLLYADY